MSADSVKFTELSIGGSVIRDDNLMRFSIRVETWMPDDMIAFEQGGRICGVITNIGRPPSGLLLPSSKE